MASLIETLIEVLDKENDEYEKLLDLSDNKTSAIVQGDVEKLQEILVNEQKHINQITALDKKREENVKDISNVLNLPKDNVKVDMIIGMLEKQPKERDALRNVHLKLKRTLNQLMKINDNNKLLMKESMDMIEFELNLAQNALRAPQTGNYSKGAYEQSTMPDIGKFDAKQ